MRGPPLPIKTWHIQPQGLSAFDAHPLTGVFAALSIRFPLCRTHITKIASLSLRSSAIGPGSWRAQKIVINSLNQLEPLSSFHTQTGLGMAPLRSLPSPFIPRLSSLCFHPKEMLYGLGQPDGTSKCSIYLSIVWIFESDHSFFCV